MLSEVGELRVYSFKIMIYGLWLHVCDLLKWFNNISFSFCSQIKRIEQMMLTHLSLWSKMIKNDSKNYLSQQNSIPLHKRKVYEFRCLGVYRWLSWFRGFMSLWFIKNDSTIYLSPFCSQIKRIEQMMLTHLSFWSKMIKNDSKNYLSQRNNIPLHI